MPKPSQRSTSLEKKKVKSPSGKAKVHYIKKNSNPAKCASCKKPLHGVPRGLPAQIKKLKKTQKRPDRPYGGNLCSACTRSAIKSKNMERWKNA